MPFIQGKKLSENLDLFPLKKQKSVLKQIGESVAKLHKENIIHGDLTTSNMILVDEFPAHLHSQINKKINNEKNNKLLNNNYKSTSSLTGFSRASCPKADAEQNNFKIFFIDFGLGYQNGKYEDKAVDIHLLKQALEAKHFKNWQILFEEFVKGYKKINLEEAEKVLNQLSKVEKRGRYRH